MKEKFDVIVIGGGPGGTPAAMHLAGKGKKVLLVEKSDKLGGADRREKIDAHRRRGGYSSAPHSLGVLYAPGHDHAHGSGDINGAMAKLPGECVYIFNHGEKS